LCTLRRTCARQGTQTPPYSVQMWTKMPRSDSQRIPPCDAVQPEASPAKIYPLVAVADVSGPGADLVVRVGSPALRPSDRDRDLLGRERARPSVPRLLKRGCPADIPRRIAEAAVYPIECLTLRPLANVSEEAAEVPPLLADRHTSPTVSAEIRCAGVQAAFEQGPPGYVSWAFATADFVTVGNLLADLATVFAAKAATGLLVLRPEIVTASDANLTATALARPDL
jgi:hypothetical protein